MPRSEVHGNGCRQTACCPFLTILSGIVVIFRPKNTRVSNDRATLFIWLIIAACGSLFSGSLEQG